MAYKEDNTNDIIVDSQLHRFQEYHISAHCPYSITFGSILCYILDNRVILIMAKKYIKLELPDNSNELLYVKKEGRKVYRGYKTDYLEQNLTTIEQVLMTCKKCFGIVRAASLCKGETVCFKCSGTNKLNPVTAIQNSVATIKIKCPLLRNCGWKGILSEAESHLNDCLYFVVQCEECNDTFPREEKDRHNSSFCPFRMIQCIFCDNSSRVKDEDIHLEGCEEFPLACPNNCENDIPRGKLSSHRSQCELEMVECPYKEFGCESVSMLRRDLLAHKKENVIEHTDLSLSEIQRLQTEVQLVNNENNWLVENVAGMKLEMKIMKKLDEIELQIPDVREVKENEYLRLNICFVNSYHIAAFVRCKRNGISTGLYLRLKRITGLFDINLGNSYITHYKLIVVNKVDYERSKYIEGRMNYQLQIGLKSDRIFLPEWMYRSYIAADNSLCIRMYFDVNAQRLENLTSAPSFNSFK